MSMNKIANINLETTADYQSLSGLNVQFWNQDKGTAVLQFNITRNNYPLGLSTENVKVFIALESGDSFLVDDNLDYVDELNGVVAYTIPNEFMRVATSVKGQVYVTTLDEEEVVVQRQFTFTVANDLIADLPSEDKIREIKYFSDMRAEVAQMMEKLNYDFEHMNDYVTQVEQTTKDGITSLTNLIDTKQKAYNDNHTAKLKELNDKGTEYSNKFDSDKQYIDEKTEAFKESVLGSGLVTQGEVTNWQKYKLSNDDGTLSLTNLQKNLEAFQSLAPGNYYLSNVPISDMGQTSATGFATVVWRDDATVKHITFKPYNSNQEFGMRYYNSWSDWELVSTDYSKIESPTEAQNKANTAESNAKVYTDTRVDQEHAILFSGSVNGVNNTVNLTGSMDNYEFIIVSGDCAGNDFSQIVVPSITGSIVNMQNLNLRDSDGLLLGVYEVRLEITSTTIKITNDVAYDHPSDTGSGPNRNAYTITRVEGVHKK